MPKLQLPELLDALSINSAGTDTWNLIISEGHDSLDKILALTPDQISQVGSSSKKTIGLSRAIKIVESLKSPRIQAILPNFTTWLDTSVKAVASLALDLKGKKVCFTGTAPIARDALKRMLVAAGAEVQSSVSSRTEILFLEDENSTSTKAKEARKLGVTLMPYSALGI